MRLRLSVLPCLLLSLATGACHAAPEPAATSPADWNGVAKRDVQFAIDVLRRSHVGAIAGQYDIVASLETSSRSALLEAEQAKTERDYKRTLARLIFSVADPHTGINLQQSKIRAWNGLVLDRAGDLYRVAWSEPGWPHPLPPVNAVAQSCDGVWTGSFLKFGVTPFIPYGAEFPAAASTAARQAMFDNGLVVPPKQCTFALPDGSMRSYELPLREASEIGDERLQKIRRQFIAKARPPGLYPLADGMHWVGMPDFNGAKSGPAYEKLYPELEKLHKANWIVFDLRGNGGGDSSWGSRALNALYGKDYSAQLGELPAYAKLLIADQATIKLYQQYATSPDFAATRDESESILRKLEAGMAKGDKLVQVYGSTAESNASIAAKVRQRPGGPRIAAVIDRNCFSSCMNFLQQLRGIGDTVVLGETTWGYSPTGEINRFDLPSGNGALFIPSALYSSAQATREPFVPDLAYPGDLTDDERLMKWVAAELAKLKPGQKPR
jgi:hypothetical protein